MHTWAPSYTEFHDVFTNGFCVKILTLIHRQSRKGVILCAADIAKLLDIHVSTATKYLELLVQHELVEKEQIVTKPGKPTYYRVVSSSVSLTLDLDSFGEFLEATVTDGDLPNPSIRELPNLAPRVVYEIDTDGLVTAFLIQLHTKARRVKKIRIPLSPLESALMKYLPHPTMSAEPFLEVCQNAGIIDYYSQKTLLSFLEKLVKYAIIEQDGN